MTTDKKQRKETPITRGVLDYFPDAIAAVANLSYVTNEQHNPGEPMHWAREKSTDHADCIVRHLLERGKIDNDGLRHSAKVAWRALALLQLEIEQEKTPTCKGYDELPPWKQNYLAGYFTSSEDVPHRTLKGAKALEQAIKLIDG